MRDALRRVEGLLLLEGVNTEELLEPLVGKVDAELLKRVGVEDLEAEDVEHTDEPAARPVERAVDLGDEVGEERAVDGLGGGGASVERLGGAQLDQGRLAAHL